MSLFDEPPELLEPQTDIPVPSALEAPVRGNPTGGASADRAATRRVDVETDPELPPPPLSRVRQRLLPSAVEIADDDPSSILDQ